MASSALGLLAAAIAVLCFGSNFLPVKKYYCGDGIFFQWVMCTGILVVGICVQLYQSSPQFEPLAMVGGFLWATGNNFCVPVIHFIGMGMGLLIWGSVSLVMGWCSGRFGFFGLDKQAGIEYDWLNILGGVICLCSIGVSFFVRTTVSDPQKDSLTTPILETPVLDAFSVDQAELLGNGNVNKKVEEHSDFGSLDQLSERQKQILGYLGATIAGCFFGLNFDPPQYLIDHPDSTHYGKAPHSTRGLDYVFSHFVGIWLTSTAWVLVYCAVKNNQPSVNPSIILPGFVSGVIWAIAQTSWFVANQELSFMVTFPIISVGPGLVGSLWGVFFYGEIQGRRNLTFLALAFITAGIGVGMIVVSKFG